MIQEFFANGKLLLSAEYFVLDGAKSIALPTKIGQHLTVEPSNDSNFIFWNAKLHNNITWFTAKIDAENLTLIESSNESLGKKMVEILVQLKILNPKIFQNSAYKFTTRLDFPKDWGLGSSSTLIALLAKFANIDAFKLLEKTFGGSGYDISCAMLPKVQTYQKLKKEKKINFVELHQNITNHIYFVYLNQKQNSREGIELYRSQPKNSRLIKSISEITDEILKCDDLSEFEDMIFVHETLISNYLGIQKVQEKHFADYKNGFIKSLGAWGGDFVMATNESDDLSYFKQKGFDVIFSYKDLIV